MNTTVWPCDYGTGVPRGMHYFESNASGVVCCRHCGARPRTRSESDLFLGAGTRSDAEAQFAAHHPGDPS